MRISINLDDRLMRVLRARAHRSEKSFNAIVNEILRAGLAAGGALSRPRPYKLQPQSMGAARGVFHFHKALLLADRLEDDEILHEMQLNK